MLRRLVVLLLDLVHGCIGFLDACVEIIVVAAHGVTSYRHSESDTLNFVLG